MKIKKRNLALCISVVVFIIFIFTEGLRGKIYPAATYSIPALFAIAVLLAWKYLPKEIQGRRTWVLPVLMMIVMISFNNHNIANGSMTQLWFSLAVYFFYICACHSNKWHKYFLFSMKCAGCFYIFMTFFVSASPKFFMSVVVPMFQDYGYMPTMIQLYNQGIAVGFAPHYSTTAMYLAVTTGIFAALMFGKKKKHSDVIMVLLGLAAIFFSGKRAHSIFSLVSIVVVYYFANTEKKINRWIKIIMWSILALGGFVIAAEYVPQLNNFVNRFIETAKDGNLEMGRDVQRALAILLWSRNPFLGIGWDGYKYTYLDMNGIILNVHNVYLQLLCEVGIIGSIPFFVFFIFSLRHTIKAIKEITRKNLGRNEALNYSLYIQIFFLLYCLTGNPLYDAATLVTYVMGAAIGEYYYNLQKYSQNCIV